MIGRIDVHSHLLPGIDDGCESVAESIACATRMVEAGYTHSFVTPHIWPQLNNSVLTIPQRTAELQHALDESHVPLKLIPGGEINLIPDYMKTDPKEIPTYGMLGRHVLFDLWANTLPDFVIPSIRWFQSLGITVILAHPERMRAIQDDPTIIDALQKMNVLLQGNLQCLSDPPNAATCRMVQRFLEEDRYFILGSDLHNLRTLDVRLNGLKRAIEMVGDERVWTLTSTNPRQLANTFVDR